MSSPRQHAVKAPVVLGRRARRDALIRRVAGLGLLAVAAIAVLVLVLGGGRTQTLHLRLQNASQLVNGNLVEVGGVGVGTVKEIELTNDNLADVTIEVTDESLLPLRRGTRAFVRVPSVSGVAQRYVALHPGPNSGPELRDGDVIPAVNTQAAVDLDALISTFDADTRTKLQGVIRGGAGAYAGAGRRGLNRAIKYLSPALGQMDATLGELVADRPALQKFIVASSNVVSAVADRRSDLEAGLAAAATTTGALAAERRALQGVLASAPSTLNKASRTLRSLAATLDVVTPTARAAQPVAPRLSRTLTTAAPALERSATVLPRLRRLLEPLRGVLAGLPALRASSVPAFSAAARAVQGAMPIIDGARPYVPDALLGATNGFGGTAAGYYDANGGYARIAFVGGPYSASGFGTLVPHPQIGGLRYGNWHRCPGAATQVAADGSNKIDAPGCKESQRP
jgi:phospholipid/cholesterol/gamma-HCH transport system substrate-binding protein